MAEDNEVLQGVVGNPSRFHFYCLGCEEVHAVYVAGSPSWEWNGDRVKPTFKPSLLIQSGHFTGQDKNSCWCNWKRDHPDDEQPFICRQCHSFITDGMIQYLGDCSHKLAGQTIPLPTWNSIP